VFISFFDERQNFLKESKDLLQLVVKDFERMEKTFKELVEFFAEDPKQIDAEGFFSIIVNFSDSLKVSSPFFCFESFVLCVGC
jgi:hypothetical protein